VITLCDIYHEHDFQWWYVWLRCVYFVLVLCLLCVVVSNVNSKKGSCCQELAKPRGG
jgi:hypothetical protein